MTDSASSLVLQSGAVSWPSIGLPATIERRGGNISKTAEIWAEKDEYNDEKLKIHLPDQSSIQGQGFVTTGVLSGFYEHPDEVLEAARNGQFGTYLHAFYIAAIGCLEPLTALHIYRCVVQEVVKDIANGLCISQQRKEVSPLVAFPETSSFHNTHLHHFSMAEANSTANGRIVGSLACQQNSYLKTLETDVVSCVKAPKDAGKGSKKKKQDTAAQDEWLIECADSVLFPEGMYVIAYLGVPLSPGDRVRQEVDWPRRWDHMQQHTGQHLLSAIMMKHQSLKTLGWGMGTEGGMNYVDLPRKPTEEEMRAIQILCNEHIRDNIPIKVETPDDAKHDRLPGDYDKSEGVVRVISIGDIDLNTCCGTHLSQTSHISLILLGSTQSVHGKSCRLSFIAGDRAIALANASVGAVSSIAKLMSSNSASDEVVNRVSGLCDTVADLRRTERKLMLEVAKYESDRVNAVIRSGGNAWVHRTDGGMDFINKVVGETKDAVQGTGLVVVLAIGEAKGAGPIVIVGDKESVEVMADRVKAAVKDVKGGGAAGKWQGKVREWQHSNLVALKELVEPKD
ncbi:hypothetical protein FZEAL_661 [Fusarium zealandicum]|uniref:Threonyl/alanyl tRNA synthetase SAD domain-containing protein n=1 Tax=Fusarium zealandicum TaxID=1053134 RepID=A0A8H4UUA5_9HYPO|nr:hypothetical protein FZEAL_661 [Fusarium zealandicum]